MVVAGSTHMDGRQDGTEDISQSSVYDAGVPASHHNWYALMLPEWGQL